MSRAMGSHQSARMATCVWLTPPAVLAALGPFDLDPCACSDPRPWSTAAAHLTAEDDGLAHAWGGRAFLNPPYGPPPVIGPWMRRMASHGRGVALIFARTETELFFETVWGAADALLFLEGRLHFHRPEAPRPKLCEARGRHAWITYDPKTEAKACADCGVAKANAGAPSVLAAYGRDDAEVLAECGLAGQFVPLVLARGVIVAALEPTWVEAVADWLQARSGPVPLDELYRAFQRHPKARRNPNWRAKVRQSLQRGAGRRVGRATWAAAEVAA